MVRLKASPVGEKPKGDSSTMAPESSNAQLMPGGIHLAHHAAVLKINAIHMMPTGRAVMKLPEITRTVEPAMGVLGRPWLKAASIS